MTERMGLGYTSCPECKEKLGFFYPIGEKASVVAKRTVEIHIKESHPREDESE